MPEQAGFLAFDGLLACMPYWLQYDLTGNENNGYFTSIQH